jgi:hypothetical protein
VSTGWQWSVDLYKNRNETAQRRNNTQSNTKNTETQTVQNGQQKYKTKANIKRILENICRLIRK